MTLLDTVIKQEVLDKINSSSEEVRDEHGRTKQDYVDLNVKVPDFFKTKINPDEELNKDENYETIALELKIKPDEIDFMIQGEDSEVGTRLYYKDKYVLSVAELPSEIEEIIKQFDIINK